jgi:GNAT superfamily N-acetyltransferase
MVIMKIVRYKKIYLKDLLCLHDYTFKALNLNSFTWQPCQQIESLEKNCEKYIYKEHVIIGYIAAYKLDYSHFRLNLIVHPNHINKGIGTLLLDRISEKITKAGGKYLQARLLENMNASLIFALSRGFQEIHRMRGMSLRSIDFSFNKSVKLGEKLSGMGFVVTTLKKELEANNNPIDKLAELNISAREGWPSPDPTQEPNISTDNSRALFTNIGFPDYFSIMKNREEYVGYTSAKNPMTATAVHPNYRGLGIGTFLKAYDIKNCIDNGQEYFESATANPAMQRVNEKLGYKLNGLCEVRLVKIM